MNGRDIFRKYSLFLKFGIFLFSLFGKNINYFFWLIFRCLPGRIGILIRFFIVKNLTYECGDNVVIFENVIIRNFSNLTIGDNVSIHPMCYIDASGGIVIQDNVSIAHSTSILSSSHTWDNNNIPIKYNPCKFNPTIINKDVWVGCGVRILYGVNIGSRTIIAAGAVVCKNADSHSIYAGIPARKIKMI